VTAVYVATPYASTIYGEAAVYYAGPSPREHKRFSEMAAKKAFAPIEAEAKKAGVACETVHAMNFPADAIIDTAKAKGCDLIVMASHGRRGIARALLGSQAVNVLTHSTLPVLICR